MRRFALVLLPLLLGILRPSLAFGCASFVLAVAGCWAVRGIDAVAWEPPAAEATAPDRGLEAAELVADGLLAMPEDVAVDPADPDRTLYTGVEDGRIVKVVGRHRGETRVEPFATVPGTPLGLKFGTGGILYACVSGHGLVAVGRDGAVRDLVTAVDGQALVFANDLDVGPDGTIYFTESSTRFDAAGAGPVRAIAENRADGRVLAHDPKTGDTRVVATGLYFPNGVTVTHGGQALLVAETARYRLSRVWLAGPRAGETEVVPHPLPGIPDGLMHDGAGTVWIALVPRNPLLDGLAPHPWLRNAMAGLPDGVLMGMAAGKAIGLVAALDEEGRLKRLLQDDTGRMKGGVANVTPVGRDLYLGTKWGHWVAVLRLP